DWTSFTLDILMTGVQQQLSPSKECKCSMFVELRLQETLPKLKSASEELRRSLPSSIAETFRGRGRERQETLLLLDFVDAALRRLEGATRQSSPLTLRSGWSGSVQVPAELELCLQEELALAQCAK
ncbi:unnamed protein product, partial [Symbiodinium necroappetens]